MTAAERALVRTMASILAEMVFRQPSVTMRSANTSITMLGFDVEKILQGQVKDLGADPAPLTPRPKYVAIEHAPDLKNIAERWKHNGFQNGQWASPHQAGRYDKLLGLGDDPDREAVRGILGNTSWTHLSCDGCDEAKLLRAVRIEGPYGDGHRYCPTCIREAAALLDTME